MNRIRGCLKGLKQHVVPVRFHCLLGTRLGDDWLLSSHTSCTKTGSARATLSVYTPAISFSTKNVHDSVKQQTGQEQRPQLLQQIASDTRGLNVERTLRTNWSGVGPPRFWKKVEVAALISSEIGRPAEHVYCLKVDGKTLCLSPQQPLLAPTLPLALALLYEWDRQSERLRPALMPLTRLLAKSLSVDDSCRALYVREILEHFGADSLCFLEHAHASLLARQERLWRPLRENASQVLGVPIKVTAELATAGIQSDFALQRMQEYLDQLDLWSLVALHSIACLSKSAIIGLNIQQGRISTEEAVLAGRCVEDWQADLYGVVEGEHDVDRAFLRANLGAASVLCRLARAYPETFANASSRVCREHV